MQLQLDFPRPVKRGSAALARFLRTFECGRFITLLNPLGAPDGLFPLIPRAAWRADDSAVRTSLWPSALKLEGWPFPMTDILFFDGEKWSDRAEPDRTKPAHFILARAERIVLD